MTMSEMEKVMKDTKTEIHILASLEMEKLMAKEFTLGLTLKYMMESEIWVSSKAMGYGKGYKVIHILENGNVHVLMDTVFIHGRMEIGMKGNGKIVSSMEQGLIFLQMEMCILDNIIKESPKAKDNIFGKMGCNTLENLKVV